ncbi:MAG: substrate-binding domain-containing protein [Verrucomicrobiota bacterium]
MKPFSLSLSLVLAVLVLGASISSAARPREIWERYSVAFIGKDGSDPVFGAARTGARDAANRLELAHKLEIKIVDLTAMNRDSAAQAEALQKAYADGANGVIISVADPTAITPVIDSLMQRGIPTVTFDGDAPQSSRLATVQTDNSAMGKALFMQISEELPSWGSSNNVAILAGDTSSPGIAKRLAAIKQAAAEQEKVEIFDIYPCPESVNGAREILHFAMNEDRNEEIDGWIFLTKWPLMGVAQLPWQPGEMPCVAADALPPSLPYLAQGSVDALIAQQYYRWGYLAMDALIKFIHLKESPQTVLIETQIELVTSDDLADYGAKWADWMQ